MFTTTSRSLALLSLVFGLVRACADHGDDHDHVAHVHAKRAIAPVISSPSSPLVWGDLNFIHTTDTHGWLLGHQKTSSPEPNYSGTLGSFASFVEHMKAIAHAKNVDLLLIDSGDLHDGNGLTDGGPPGSVDAHDANKQVAKLPWDIMAIGNHELYIYNNTLDMHQNFVPKINGRYLSSNVNITINGVSKPVGDRFVKFKTRLGRKVTALGVLFDFTDNDVGTTVQPVADMVKESWFLSAIKEAPDFFLLVGHMPVQRDNWPAVFNAVRAVHPTTPIIIFGGHTHIRDCVQLDGRSMSLESGRYMETVGWLSADLRGLKSNKNITFSRRYLDANDVTYAYHTHVPAKQASTPLGRSVDAGLNAIAKEFDITMVYGTAPQDYFLDRTPFPGNSSLLSLVADQVMPIALTTNNTRKDNPKIIITNSGSLRFDLFAGQFTKNDQLIVSPFDDTFLFIPGIPFSVASQVLDEINDSGTDVKKRAAEISERRLAVRMGAASSVRTLYGQWRREMYERGLELERRAPGNLTLGYVTKDSCPGVGDDTAHTAIPFFDTPDFIASPNPTGVSNDTAIDLVFVDFIESDILRITSQLSGKTFTESDVQSYTPIAADAMLGVFAQQAWN